MKRRRNRPAGSVCEMVELVKEIQQLDFGRKYCRYISEHFDKYIILILANLRIVRNVIRNFREKTTMTRHYKYKHGNEHHLPHPPPPQEGCLHSFSSASRRIRLHSSSSNDKISDKTKHIMKISHINVNIYDKTVTSQQK